MSYNMYHLIFVKKRMNKEFRKDLQQTTAEIFTVRDFKKFYKNIYSLITFLTINFC